MTQSRELINFLAFVLGFVLVSCLVFVCDADAKSRYAKGIIYNIRANLKVAIILDDGEIIAVRGNEDVMSNIIKDRDRFYYRAVKLKTPVDVESEEYQNLIRPDVVYL